MNARRGQQSLKNESQALVVCKKNFKRATSFLAIHKVASGPKAGAPIHAVRELPRAALIYGVGAVDAFLSDFSAEMLVAQLEFAISGAETREVLKRLQGEFPTAALEIAVLRDQIDRKRRLQEIIAEYFHTKVSHHGSKAVSQSLVRLGSRPEKFWEGLLEDWRDKDSPSRYLDNWTTLRHEIVHQGKAPSVRRPDAMKFLKFGYVLCGTFDAMVRLDTLNAWKR